MLLNQAAAGPMLITNRIRQATSNGLPAQHVFQHRALRSVEHIRRRRFAVADVFAKPVIGRMREQRACEVFHRLDDIQPRVCDGLRTGSRSSSRSIGRWL